MKTTINTKKTYTIELDQEEMNMLWHRFNLSESKFSDAYNPDEDVPYPEDSAPMCHRMWTTLDMMLRYDSESES